MKNWWRVARFFALAPIGKELLWTHLPCTIHNPWVNSKHNRCVVPPILKLCPLMDDSPFLLPYFTTTCEEPVWGPPAFHWRHVTHNSLKGKEGHGGRSAELDMRYVQRQRWSYNYTGCLLWICHLCFLSFGCREDEGRVNRAIRGCPMLDSWGNKRLRWRVKGDSINRSHNLQQHQNTMQSMAKTAIFNEFIRSRWNARKEDVFNSYRLHLEKQDDLGATLLTINCSLQSVCNPGAPLMWCHSSTQKARSSIAPLLTDQCHA